MSTTALKFIPIVLLLLGSQAPVALALAQSVRAAASTASRPSVAERLHANAVASFRQARFPEAYGRFITGHAPAAELALWMYLHGPSVFGREWDSSQEQLTAWAQLVGQSAPTLVASSYPRTVTPAASLPR
jgi:hypothetical protein